MYLHVIVKLLWLKLIFNYLNYAKTHIILIQFLRHYMCFKFIYFISLRQEIIQLHIKLTYHIIKSLNFFLFSLLQFDYACDLNNL